MTEYLASDPIMWVKSEVYQRFLCYHITLLKDLQIKLSRRRPANYGSLTSLIMHLIRLSVTTPQAKHGFLHDALADLKFGPIIERFGMFFLHDLDLDTCFVPEIDGEDGQEAKRLFKTTGKAAHHIPMVSVPTALHPLGCAPTWAQVVMTMDANPTQLIWGWVWDDSWASNRTAASLFIDFTVDMWLSLNPNPGLLQVDPPYPQTLEDAMKTWSAESLLATFTVCKMLV